MTLTERMAQTAGQDNGLSTILGGVPSGGVQEISVEKLHPYPGHTFRIHKEAAHYQALVESLRQSGVKTPLLVRPARTVGEYEMIAGHTRHSAAQEAGLSTVPCIVRPMTDAEATRLMVETNIQRPEWLPSEKARSYKAWLEAVKEESGIRAGRPKDNSPTGSANLRTDDLAARRFQIDGDTLRIYVKLNALADPLLDLTDEGRITVKAAYQLAFLDKDHQRTVYSVFAPLHGEMKEDTARELRFLAQHQSRLTPDDVRDVLRGGQQTEKPKAVSFSVPASAFPDATAAKKLKRDVKFQLALAEWVRQYMERVYE